MRSKQEKVNIPHSRMYQYVNNGDGFGVGD